MGFIGLGNQGSGTGNFPLEIFIFRTKIRIICCQAIQLGFQGNFSGFQLLAFRFNFLIFNQVIL